MKTLLASLILCVSCCLSSLAQPTPTRPLSLTATDPATLQAFVRVADTLRVKAAARITALTDELAALDQALASNQKLSKHDYERSQQLSAELTVATDSLNRVEGMLTQVRNQLPRRFRKRAAESVQALYTCLGEYEADLKRRGGRLFVVGAALGFTAGFLLFH